MSLTLQNDVRTITYWDLEVKGIPRVRRFKTSSPLSLKTLLFQLQKLRVKFFREPEALVYKIPARGINVALSGISINDQFAVVLFRIMDSKSSRQTFRNVITQRTRIAERYENEAVEYNMHLAISLKGNPNMPNFYSCVAEECPVLPVAFIVRTLNKFLKDSAFIFETAFKVPHPDGQVIRNEPEMMKTFNRVDLYGHPSQNLEDELRDGTLTGIVAITKFDIDGSIDSSGTVTPIAKEVKFSVSKNVIGKDNYSYLQRVRSYSFAEDYSILKVQFRDKNNSPYTLDLNSSTGALVDEKKFIKKLVVEGFTKELTTSSMGEFNGELVEKMVTALGLDVLSQDRKLEERVEPEGVV